MAYKGGIQCVYQKILGLPKPLNTTALYDKIVLQLPITSSAGERKAGKVRVVMIQRYA